jgi:hypothetical protein
MGKLNLWKRLRSVLLVFLSLLSDTFYNENPIICKAYKGSVFDVNVVKTTLATNFYGTLKVCNYLLPIIKPNGRLINIASSSGQLRNVNEKLAKQFTNEDLDIDGLIALMKKFEVCQSVWCDSWIWSVLTPLALKLGWRRKRNLAGRRMAHKLYYVKSICSFNYVYNVTIIC